MKLGISLMDELVRSIHEAHASGDEKRLRAPAQASTRARELGWIAAFLLAAFVFVEMLVIGASLVCIAPTAKLQAVPGLLPMIAILLPLST